MAVTIGRLTLSLLAASLTSGVTAPLYSAVVDQSSLRQELGFRIRNFRIHHREHWRTLDLTALYSVNLGATAPDASEVKDCLIQFLCQYSGHMDYWEIVNNKAVKLLVQRFPAIRNLQLEIAVSPDATVSFNRRSIVTLDETSLDEAFGFTLENFVLGTAGFSRVICDVFYQYTPHTSDYPNVRWVGEAVELFIQENPIATTDWEVIKPRLIDFLQGRFPMMRSVNVVFKSGSDIAASNF